MTLKGTAVSPGVVVGKVYRYERFVPTFSSESPESTASELAHYLEACRLAREEMDGLRERFQNKNEQDKADILSAHLEILGDETVDEELRGLIEAGHMNGQRAIQTVYEQYANMFEKLPDPTIRERAADLRDIEIRLLRCWEGLPEQELSVLPPDTIVVAWDLVPSDTATLDRDNVRGIITEVGGTTSHSAIIARNYEIPAVLGVTGAISQLQDGQPIILDAVDGVVLTELNDQLLEVYQTKGAVEREQRAHTKLFIDCEPVTPDGVRIEVELNIAAADPDNLAGAKYTDGVGLFRTEFLYMGRNTLPSEEEQFQAYRKVLITFQRRPVVLRTMDIGGDKPLECLDMPAESNPFLGNRALRLCFRHPELLHTQLRAALRASAYGNLWLMFPMVASMDDIYMAKAALEQVKAELKAEGHPFQPDFKTGIMVEIPSIAILADQAAAEVDFASIGTNDLTQYLMAVDRGNPAVSSYYQPYHPAMFRLIRHVVSAFAKQGKPVSVCGELGGDPLAAAVLIGSGIRRVSMNISSVASVKEMILSTDLKKAAALSDAVCMMTSAEEVKRYLKKTIYSEYSVE